MSFLFELAFLLLIVFSVLTLFIRPQHTLASCALGGIGVLLAAGAVGTWTNALGQPLFFNINRLSAIYVLLLGVVVSACAIFSPRYLEHLKDQINSRFYWSSLYLFIAGMLGVLLSANAILFLVFWEMMSLSSAALVGSEFKHQKAQKAALIYLAATRIATGFLCAGFLMQYSLTQSWSFVSWQFHSPDTWLSAVLILIGLSIKAGIFPFHLWLPYAHPQAPSPVSALMSGVMVKVAIYAMIRLFVFGGLDCVPLISTAFIIGCLSAFWGVLWATNQQSIKRLLAYSTVENVSMLLIAIMLSIWARHEGWSVIAELALIAALIHSLAHGLFKSLLFLGAGSIHYAAHSTELTNLGGMLHRMPWTGAAFIVASAAACALPPLNGFGSKLYLYHSMLQAATAMTALPDRALFLSAIGLLAACGSLALACYVKAIGVTLLGKPRSKQSAQCQETPVSMIAAQVLLASACVLMGLATPQVARLLSPLAASASEAVGLPVVPDSMLAHPAVSFVGTAAALLVAVVAIYTLILRQSPRRYRTWDCGFGSSTAKTQVTSASFAQPIARIFTPVLQHSVAVEISGRDRRHFPEKIIVQPSLVSILETKVYAPATELLNRLSGLLAKLQAGSIHVYLLYLCCALVLLIVLGTKLW